MLRVALRNGDKCKYDGEYGGGWCIMLYKCEKLMSRFYVALHGETAFSTCSDNFYSSSFS